MLLMVVTVITFFILAMFSKILTGKEQLIYYHQKIAILTATAIALWFVAVPILPYLDIMTLGIGTFMVCGRFGCFMMGCCHGRPNRFGVCYQHEHVCEGFTKYYQGIRLLPIQLIESFWVLTIVIIGILMIMNNNAPGSVFSWYIICYAVGRFCFEFMRGDPDRGYLFGLSEAQWISGLLMLFVVILEQKNIIPENLWHWHVTGIVFFVMMFVIFSERYSTVSKYKIYRPRHVKEIANILSSNNLQPTDKTKTTSLGIQVSSGVINDNGRAIQHYAISCLDGAMSDAVATLFAKLIMQLKHPGKDHEIIKGGNGVIHILVND